MMLHGLGITQAEMLAEQNAGLFDTSGSTSWGGVLDVAERLIKSALPVWSQYQQAKMSQAAQEQALRYQLEMAKLRNQSPFGFGLPFAPSRSYNVTGGPGYSPAYVDAGGMDWAPYLLIGGGLLAAYLLLK